MILYAESSAVLAWLLEEPGAERIADSLAASALLITSDLTLVEADRTIECATATGRLTSAEAAAARARLAAAHPFWVLMRLSSSILQRAREPFPAEPIRTLDALHLATILEARAEVVGLGVLSLDARVRANAAALSLPVVP